MKTTTTIPNQDAPPLLTSELLILPDGQILVHNLTQPFAEILATLNPNDEQIAARANDLAALAMQHQSIHSETLSTCNCNQAPEFHIEGKIIYSTRPTNQRPGSELYCEEKDFIVVTKGPQWKIRTTNLNRAQNDTVEFQEMGCDGTNTFELQQMDPSGFPDKEIISVLGRVQKGTIPAYLDSGLIYPLWLTYCSSDYFLSRKDDRIPAPFFPERGFLNEASSRPVFLSGKWKMNASSFVSGVEWYCNGKFPAHGEPQRLETYPPPFDRGFLQASFETTSWVDFSGMQLSGGFGLEVFAPDCWREQAEGKCEVLFDIKGRAQVFQALRNPSFVPELTRKTMITDTRYRIGGSTGCCLAYESSSNWDTEEQVEAKLNTRKIRYAKQAS